jgi:hypothetical protein
MAIIGSNIGIKITSRFSGHIKKNAWKPGFESAVSVGPQEPWMSDNR